MRNLEPPEKKKAYVKTGLFIAIEAANEMDNWDEKAIERREKRLLEWARREWGE